MVLSSAPQTSIVNIAVDSCEVYIGRGTERYIHMLTPDIVAGTEGWLGNPHPIGSCRICGETHDRAECIQRFTEDFLKRVASDAEFRKAVLALKGRVLGCYCKPKDCHGDVILEWIESQDTE